MRIQHMPQEERDRVAREIEWARRTGAQANGIYYTEELAGPGGMDYTLFPAEGTPREELDKAEAQLRAEQDVVGVYAFYVPADMVAPDDRDKPSKSAEEKIAKLRDIVKNGFNKVDGVAVDLYSASAILAIYDALNEENKAKYASYPIAFMADLAFRYINEQNNKKKGG